jgi:glycosyltransferase involved in cell wall biosynthesis
MHRFFRERGVDMVHTNSLKAHVYAGIAARICGIPLVWHLRDSIHESYLPATSVRGMRWLGRMLPRKIVTVSRSVARHLTGDAHSQRCAVVYDGLRDGELENLPAPAGAADGDITIGMVGRLTRWKGQHVFLEAAALLSERGLRARFEIVGEALFGEEDYKRELQARCRELGMEPEIHFCGAVNDVSLRIRRWRALVHASISPDPCPNVVLEAMAAGVPVVGSDGGGVPEILEEGRLGWLHPMGDSRALANVLETILQNPQKAAAMATDARMHAGRVFTASRAAREVEACWAELALARPWQKRRWPQIEAEEPVSMVASKGNVDCARKLEIPKP